MILSDELGRVGDCEGCFDLLRDAVAAANRQDVFYSWADRAAVLEAEVERLALENEILAKKITFIECISAEEAARGAGQ